MKLFTSSILRGFYVNKFLQKINDYALTGGRKCGEMG